MATARNPWTNKDTLPRRKGWYITRTEDGFVSWRAWGNGEWWKQTPDGWISWFDGDGCAKRFDYLPKTRRSVDLDMSRLPPII